MKYILVAEEALPVEGPQESKTKSLLLEQNKPKIVRYKTKFGEDWTEVTVIQFIRTRRSSDTEPYQVPDVPVAKGSGDLSQAKKTHQGHVEIHATRVVIVVKTARGKSGATIAGGAAIA